MDTRMTRWFDRIVKMRTDDTAAVGSWGWLRKLSDDEGQLEVSGTPFAMVHTAGRMTFFAPVTLALDYPFVLQRYFHNAMPFAFYITRRSRMLVRHISDGMPLDQKPPMNFSVCVDYTPGMVFDFNTGSWGGTAQRWADKPDEGRLKQWEALLADFTRQMIVCGRLGALGAAYGKTPVPEGTGQPPLDVLYDAIATQRVSPDLLGELARVAHRLPRITTPEAQGAVMLSAYEDMIERFQWALECRFGVWGEPCAVE